MCVFDSVIDNICKSFDCNPQVGVNDLPKGLNFVCEIFTDYTLILSKNINNKRSEIKQNKNLKLIGQW